MKTRFFLTGHKCLSSILCKIHFSMFFNKHVFRYPIKYEKRPPSLFFAWSTFQKIKVFQSNTQICLPIQFLMGLTSRQLTILLTEYLVNLSCSCHCYFLTNTQIQFNNTEGTSKAQQYFLLLAATTNTKVFIYHLTIVNI